MTLKSRLSATIPFAVLLAGAASAAVAADAPPPPANAIDTIVVTAQKRSQSLQDVPVVVTVANAQLLQDSGVHDIKDLTLLTPGLIVTSTSNEAITTARIRGIGTVGDNVGLESSVGVVIDGVYRPRNGVSFGDLGEMDHIEVLKGPQGTLFGKSTSAGVINVITKSPSFRFGADGELTVGNYSALGGSVAVTGPIVEDKLAGRLYFADRQRDGYYNVKTGAGPRTASDDQNQDFWTLRGQLLYTPANGVEWRFIGDYTKRNERCCAAVQIQDGPTTPIIQALTGGTGIAAPPNPYARNAYANRDTNNVIEDSGLSAELNWTPSFLGGAKLTSVTSYRDWKHRAGSDTDYTDADIFYNPSTNANRDEFKTFSEEIRLAGKTDRLDWLVGAFYADEDLHHNYSLVYGAQFEPYLGLLLSSGTNPATVSLLSGRPYGTSYVSGQGAVDTYHQTDKTFALFTNETLHVTQQFEITAGLRYTDDSKKLNSLATNSDSGVGCGSVLAHGVAPPLAIALLCLPFENPFFNNWSDAQKHNENELAGTIKGSYRFNRQILTYVSYARGYKAGGFNLDRTQNGATLQPIKDTSFKGEFVDSYEAGVKSTLLDRTLLLNATVFDQTFTNFQLNTFTGLVFVVDSVPVVHSKGVDADFMWLPNNALTLQGGVTYADTRYTHADQASLLPTGFEGAPGSRMSLAPLWSGSASATYKFDLSPDYQARVNVGAKYSSAYNTGSNLNPNKVQKAYTLANARLSVGPKSKLWTLEFWGENLFDQHYKQVAFDGPFQGNLASPSQGTIDAFLGAPQTYGVTLRVKY